MSWQKQHRCMQSLMYTHTNMLGLTRFIKLSINLFLCLWSRVWDAHDEECEEELEDDELLLELLLDEELRIKQSRVSCFEPCIFQYDMCI